MPRRSLHEDKLLTTALFLHTEMLVWGQADLRETAKLITNGSEIELHVVSRALRKFRQMDWVNAERDPDTSIGPRYLYSLTGELGVSAALAGAGRELAQGERYPVEVIAKFAGTTALPDTTR